MSVTGEKLERIKFNCEPALQDAIQKWRQWLESERRCSLHTIDAYFRDLSAFFEYAERHLGYSCGVSDLGSFSTLDFRGFLAERSDAGVARSTINRQMSTLRSFFKYLDRQNIVKIQLYKLFEPPNKSKPSQKPLVRWRLWKP